MKEKSNILHMQFCHMFSRLEFRISLSAVLLVTVISFCSLCGKVGGHDISEVYSAAYGWVGHAAMLDIPYMQFFFVLLIFFISSMAFADSQFVDGSINARSMILTRCSRKSYVHSGAFVSFCGAFLVILVPFLFAQFMSFIVFPVDNSMQFVHNNPAWQTPDKVTMLFPGMFYNYPYLYNLLAIFYMSVCSGIFATLSYAFSLVVKKRLMILCMPTLLVILESMLFPGRNTFSYYLFMGGIRNMTLYIYLGIPAAVLAISCCLIEFKKYKMREELT